MAHYVLTYEVIADYAERRLPHRPAHVAHAAAAAARGELLIGGALGDPIDSALLIFSADNPATAEAFARDDPYVQAGLVTRWTVKPWHVLVGADRLAPAGRDPS